MSEDNVVSRTLAKNSIKNFILRIDLIKNDQLNISQIAAGISKYFDRSEKRQISRFDITVTKGSSEVKQAESFDFVLVKEGKGISLVFSEMQNAFWLESSQYRDNTLYKDIINRTIEVMNQVDQEIKSKRIGLRYINEFKCEKPKDISMIYAKRLTSILKSMIDGSCQSRIIGMEEYNNDGYKLRLQYGIPNKFYPSVISIFDLLLDIDSFVENTNNINEWNDVIRDLNHAAYGQFTKELNPKYLEGLK